jgi:hypothetical protein
MGSHGWKPVVYVATTITAAAIMLGLVYLLVRLVYPGFSLFGLSRADGELILLIAGMIAYGSVLAVTEFLRRYFGREFGTYLDDADRIEPGERPALEKVCPRCGSAFPVFPNEFHAAGFCSRACQRAFLLRQSR